MHQNTQRATDRIEVSYTCPSAHEFTKVFAADINVPSQWDCPHCGKYSVTDTESITDQGMDAGRTHWDMVQERRTHDELMDMLAAQVKQLRAR